MLSSVITLRADHFAFIRLSFAPKRDSQIVPGRPGKACQSDQLSLFMGFPEGRAPAAIHTRRLHCLDALPTQAFRLPDAPEIQKEHPAGAHHTPTSPRTHQCFSS